jgi:uncharacterized protein (UPF0248 family)
MDADLGEPGIQAGPELELAQLLESGQEHLLQDIFDLRIVGAHKVDAKAVKLGPVEFIELTLGFFIPSQDPLHQQPLVHWFSLYLEPLEGKIFPKRTEFKV